MPCADYRAVRTSPQELEKVSKNTVALYETGFVFDDLKTTAASLVYRTTIGLMLLRRVSNK